MRTLTDYAVQIFVNNKIVWSGHFSADYARHAYNVCMKRASLCFPGKEITVFVG